MKTTHKNINILINLLIIILEIMGFVLVFKEMGITSLEYYTEDSNLLFKFQKIMKYHHGLNLSDTLQLFQQH